MSFLRTSLRLPRLRPRLPGFRVSESIGGVNAGASLSGAALAQQAKQSLDLEDLLKRSREEASGEADAPEARAVSSVPAAEPRGGPVPSRTRRRGPATLLERRDRLDDAIRRLAAPGAHIEYQANTIAVINQGNVILRLIRFLLGLPLIPLRLIARAVEWVFRPRGAGRLKRTVVFVDRRGNVVVYRM